MLTADLQAFKTIQLRITGLGICTWVLVTTAFAQTETILHQFSPASGYNPLSGVIADEQGNLYGTAVSGGAANAGVVYKLDSSGTYSVFHEFSGKPDGRSPASRLTRDSEGNFYGTTQFGGAAICGTVYKLDPNGLETILHSFTCGADGAYPFGGLTRDSAGILYGTTSSDGAFGHGTVFRLDPNGLVTVLYNFTGGKDGAYPSSQLALDDNGNLYGTTPDGGLGNNGLVFTIDPSGNYKVLKYFSGRTDGAHPNGIIRDTNGNLYGTTSSSTNSCGTAFKIDPSGQETVLHIFGCSPTDGALPMSSLSVDSSGNLYGTTYSGGKSNAGVIFKIDAATHQESVLYSFTGENGAYPEAPPLILNGNLYGTTSGGGSGVGYGVLFKITQALGSR